MNTDGSYEEKQLVGVQILIRGKKKNNNNVISKTDMNSFAVSSGFLLYRLRRGESDYQHGRLSRQPSH